ncbi:hypothetical protein [Neptuniibacter sp. QD37_11]|uniref:hypothetical protein n=1 Tax=Neptuniibacter sp. QD37_11 TaxID=3398209 RepID=UPI0039F58BFA
MSRFTLTADQKDDFASLVTVILRTAIEQNIWDEVYKLFAFNKGYDSSQFDEYISGLGIKPTGLLNMVSQILGYKSHSDLLHRGIVEGEAEEVVRLPELAEGEGDFVAKRPFFDEDPYIEVAVGIGDIIGHFCPLECDADTWNKAVVKAFSDIVYEPIGSMHPYSVYLLSLYEYDGMEREISDSEGPCFYLRLPGDPSVGIPRTTASPYFDTADELEAHCKRHIKAYRQGAVSEDGVPDSVL